MSKSKLIASEMEMAMICAQMSWCGSVEFVNRLCEWMGRGPKGRHEWHVAGARSHGWEV